MKYRHILKRIDRNARELLEKTESLAKEYEERKNERNKALEEMRKSGKYSESYLQEVENTPISADDIASRLVANRELLSRLINADFQSLRTRIDAYFSEPLSNELSSKLQLVSSCGIDLSGAELDLMLKKARNYNEIRMIKALARKKNLPIADISVPDIDGVYRALNDAETSAKRLTNYCGSENQLLGLVDAETNDIADIMRATCDSFIRQGYPDVLSNKLGELTSETLEPASDSEKELIDSFIDPKYPALARERIGELAKVSLPLADELLSIIERDSRYAPLTESI